MRVDHMSKKHNFLNDLSKLFQSALSNAANLGQEAKSSLSNKFEEIVRNMDLAHKEELDVVRKLTQKNSKDIEEIKLHLGIKAKKASTSLKARTKKTSK